MYQKLVAAAARLKFSFDRINIEELRTVLTIMKLRVTEKMLHQLMIYSSTAISKFSFMKNQLPRSSRIKTEHASKSKTAPKKLQVTSLPLAIANK